MTLEILKSPIRRGLLAGSVAALFARLSAFASPAHAQINKPAAGKNAIRPFRVSFPEAQLTDLRRRIKATKWPERELVTDASQGVQLATAIGMIGSRGGWLDV